MPEDTDPQEPKRLSSNTPLYDPYLYQITHRGNPGDIAYYRSACRNKEDILELGCGAGRILLPLAAAGHQVTGIDLHPGMLGHIETTIQHDQALLTKISYHQQDIRTFSLPHRFDRILLPYNLLFCLLTEDEILACLQRVAAHLKPAGVCLFDVYQIDDQDLDFVNQRIPFPGTTKASAKGESQDKGHGEEDDEDTWNLYAILDESDRQIEIAERRCWHPDTKRIDASYRYCTTFHKQPGHHTEAIYTIPQIYLHAHQLQPIIAEAGLMLTQTYGDFRGTPWDEESEHLVAWAMKVPE